MLKLKKVSNEKNLRLTALSLVTLLTAIASSTGLASSAKAADCLANAPVVTDYIAAGPSGFRYAQSNNRLCVVNVGDRVTFRFDAVKPEGWELFRIAAAPGAPPAAGQTYTNFVQLSGPENGLNPTLVRAGGWSSPNNFLKSQLPTRSAEFRAVLPGVYLVEIRFSVSLRNRQNQVSIIESNGINPPINTLRLKYQITVQAPPAPVPSLPQDLVGRTFVSPSVNWRPADLDAVMDRNAFTPAGYLISITGISPDATRLSGFLAPATWSNSMWSQRRCVSPTAISDLAYDAVNGIRSRSPFVHFSPIGLRQITNTMTVAPSFLAQVSPDGRTLSTIRLYGSWDNAAVSPIMGFDLCASAPNGCSTGLNGQPTIVSYTMDLADATFVPGLSIDIGYTPYLDPSCPQAN